MGNNELLSRTYPRSSSNTSSSFLDRSNTSSPDNTSTTTSSPEGEEEEEEEDEWTYNRKSDQNNNNNSSNGKVTSKSRISRGSLGSVHEEDESSFMDPELVGLQKEVDLKSDGEELDPAFGGVGDDDDDGPRDGERLVLEGDESSLSEEEEEDVRRTPRAGRKKVLLVAGGGKKDKVERVLKGAGVLGLVKKKKSKGEILGDWAVTGSGLDLGEWEEE